MAVLQIIVASTRPGRSGPVIADWFAGLARDHGTFDVELVDLAEVNLPFLDEPEHPSTRQYEHQHTKDWSATVDRADAFVFVMPEYNRAFTAPLKNALDFLYHEWKYKPVGLVNYGMSSAGLAAGTMIRQVVAMLGMVPIGPSVSVPLRWRLGADGSLDPDETMVGGAKDMLDELTRFADALAPLRV